MNTEKRKRLRELCDKATPGPWEPCGCRFSIVTAQITPQETMDICDTKINDAISCEQAEANNCFIAAARSAVPELLDALERSERIASNLDAVNKAIYRSMSEICGVAVDGFSDIQPVLMGLRVDADLFYSIKAENAALKAGLKLNEDKRRELENLRNYSHGSVNRAFHDQTVSDLKARVEVLEEVRKAAARFIIAEGLSRTGPLGEQLALGSFDALKAALDRAGEP